ncbi:MAG TPA: glycosyltransferase [Trueperaceae bacterium]|nr:glycosyltransferase [Trueperaceae bacterium]
MDEVRKRLQEDGPGVHIAMFSVHGLLRGEDLELGHDADTGGQTKYVVELARALGKHPRVARVDLVTRRLDDLELSDDYAKPVERLADNVDLVRVPAGGDEYMRKELLWPHLGELAQNAARYFEEGPGVPDVVHGHYPDAAEVAGELARRWDRPFVFTGHSLGRNKRRVLRRAGMSDDEIEEQYHIARRIEAEERALAAADMVVASTRQEVEKGYELYDSAPKARFVVIPPGVDVDRFYPYYYDLDEGYEPDEDVVKARVRMRREIGRFLREPDKPVILAISRPDRRKNIDGLVKAYGTDNELRQLANLVIFAGVRSDIEQMDDNEREVLTGLLLAMDKYDLYGRLALPKKHQPDTDIPVLYRLVAARRGVFVNPALVENFGITLIEASSSGLPVVSTDHGGPQEIIGKAGSGELIDARDTAAIQAAIKGILVDREKWERYSENGIAGVREHYAWRAHADRYVSALRHVLEATPSPA